MVVSLPSTPNIVQVAPPWELMWETLNGLSVMVYKLGMHVVFWQAFANIHDDEERGDRRLVSRKERLA